MVAENNQRYHDGVLEIITLLNESNAPSHPMKESSHVSEKELIRRGAYVSVEIAFRKALVEASALGEMPYAMAKAAGVTMRDLARWRDSVSAGKEPAPRPRERWITRKPSFAI